MITPYEFHEFCSLFPRCSDEELQLLVSKIRENGLQIPITLYEGKILDGRNRYLACRMLNREPEYVEFEGSEPLPYVISRNLCRRHLSESQRAMVAAAIHWSYANKEFREVLKVSLDEKGYREQALGKWAVYAGGCYYAFADDNIMTEEYKVDLALPILFGFDFNVDWYSITAAQYKEGMFYVFDEVRLAHSNTRAALDVLVARFGSMARLFYAYGDAAGRQRQTSADISNYLMIEAEKRIPMKVIFPHINPSVIYRIEQVNSFLKTTDRTIRLMIASKCRYLIKDLFSVPWKEGERTQDKRNPELTHMSYTLGYMLVNHEEQFGEHRVILMKEQDIQAEVQRRSQEGNGYDVTAKLIERVTGKRMVITR